MDGWINTLKLWFLCLKCAIRQFGFFNAKVQVLIAMVLKFHFFWYVASRPLVESCRPLEDNTAGIVDKLTA